MHKITSAASYLLHSNNISKKTEHNQFSEPSEKNQVTARDMSVS
jgi:hypothetical protein